ncbi:granzyme A-like [Heteronotia binoei]|uniref:granzyme A-like n=1 Tax=Heteronotia binoei TaxID=13085 RepID=UPI00292D1EBA|nr:granzyme A-like [Heteronotia binoei]
MSVLFVFSFSAAILFLGMHRGHCGEIVRGRLSIPHSRPYMAAIVKGNAIHCGGTLIQKNWVLTAAHCHINIGDKVILGAHSLSKYEKQKQVFQVTRVIRHRYYIPKTLENDIMLLKLNKCATITRSVRTIQLPRTNKDVRPGTHCLAAGWGRTESEWPSDVLQEINVTIVDRRKCNYNHRITTNKLCAIVRNLNGGVCRGDSGGPLICERIQRGITSYIADNMRCGVLRRKAPDVYTRLTKDHVVWINNITRG